MTLIRPTDAAPAPAPATVSDAAELLLDPIEAGWLERHPGKLLMVLVAIGSSAALGVAIALRPVAGLGIVAAVGLGLAVLRRPSLGGYLLAGVVPITSGLRSGWPVPVFRLSELLVGTLSVAILISASSRQSLRWRTLDWTLLAYVLGSLLIGGYDLHHDHIQWTTSLIGTLAGPMQFLLLYRAVAVSLPLRTQRNTALRLVLMGSVPVSLLALLQQLRISGVNQFIANITGSTIFTSYSYANFARATGPFNHWTPLAGYLLVILLLGITLLLHEVDGVLARPVMFLILGLAALGLLLSAELSAMIALVVGSVVLAVWAGRVAFFLRWGLLTVIIIGVIFGSYFVERLHTQFNSTSGSSRNAVVPQTINYRFEIWTQQYFPAIAERPFDGYGPALPPSIIWPDTESEYVTLLMWGGIPLLLLYVGMMWALFARARSMARPKGDDPSRWAMARAVVILVVALYPMNAIFPYTTTGGLPQTMWVLIGILIAAGHERVQRIEPVRHDEVPAWTTP